MSNESYQGGGFVGIEITGIEELIEKLGALPDEVQDEAIEAVNKYMLSVLKLDPPYAHVPFKSAYGNWFSEKQRRYVMARIQEGTITPGTPSRSQQFAQNWDVLGYGRNSMIVNPTPYGPYLVGDTEQARMPAKIGWKKLGDTIKQRMEQIIRHADAGVKNAIKKLGL
jgi:hypothetical protein